MIQHNEIHLEGLSVGVNTPKMTEQRFDASGEEIEQRLPPYSPTRLYSVDDYEGCPESWPRGSAKEGSFFFPVNEGDGLWFNFQQNYNHPKHIAVVVSVQGVNARTGLPCDGIFLEQYREKCPTHDVPFQAERYCPKCEYKWPPQNYLADTTNDPFWLDGWRRPGDKQIRQFFFTKQEMLGVAAAIEKARKDFKRTYNIGIAFFLSKDDRPPRPAYAASGAASGSVYGNSGWQTGLIGSSLQSSHLMSFNPAAEGQLAKKFLYQTKGTKSATKGIVRSAGVKGLSSTYVHDSYAFDTNVNTVQVSNNSDESLCRGVNEIAETSAGSYLAMEIGAGAIIRQGFDPDPNPLTFWQEEPALVLYLNQANAEFVASLIKSPKKTKSDGFLAGIPVGDIPSVMTHQ